MRLKLVAVSLISSSGLVLTACSYSTPGPPVDQPVGVSVDAARIQVLDNGSGERRALTFDDIGASQRVHFLTTSGFSQDVVQATRVDGFVPDELEETTTEFDLDGSVDEASDDPQQAPATRNAFFTVHNPDFTLVPVDTAEGFQVGWRAGDDGQISSLRFAAPQEAGDGPRAAIEQAITTMTSLPVVFPAEEIGTGARWSVDSRVAGETALLQTATYTLEEFTAEGAILSVEVDQRPSLGALTFYDDQGAEQQLDVLDASSSTTAGRIVVDVSQPLPVDGAVDVTTRIVYGQADSDVRVLQTIQTQMSFAPAVEQ